MKLKSLAILAMTGCIASAAYIAPAMADDANSAQSMQAPADNIGSVNTNQGADAMNNNSSQTDANGNSNGTNASGSDDASPDTATGDDDY